MRTQSRNRSNHRVGTGHARLFVLGEGHRCKASLSTGEHFPKPYHDEPLVRKIEELLAGLSSP